MPAYLLRAGFGSKLSTWLVPPSIKSQMTCLALGAKWGSPGLPALAALAMPSRNSIAPSARPVKPMPQSARKPRRVIPQQPEDRVRRIAMLIFSHWPAEMQAAGLSHRDKVVVVEQHMHQALPRSPARIGSWLRVEAGATRESG